ncbi:D-xylose ABC transporter substrate-binding protein [Mesobacillus sp. AQ2]|uniref:D-xylose ABC transporter substrate-binding protein n=1 Tax=unclassified Mesobacillus TaxID=2675270 RepID=UPI00203F3666|nr:D-xylose ABC transporter substrate-binding protein [Mesobacillus sp. AQ2]MCM3125226.1 D-xylose ABC transporter substrate-binding protein [Mesobacillus sp. MER 33]MCM3235343.1 D-xylose ABC transporter substrate-binding protein [Mesobacillus sp. MER 48]WHX40981.1 D-xylose ABC transporter substrate-binding protein [Mesobacillus sp. AQ2]
MITKFRKVGILNLIFLLMLLAACEEGGSPKHKEDQGSENESVADFDTKLKIGFSMDTLEEERWPRDRDFFKEAVESLGAEVVIREAKGDDTLQIVQAETLISEGVDLLVIVPHNAEAVATIVNKAHSAGIKVISYDRLVKNSSVDLYISFDNELVGELQAKAITKLVPKGKYVYIGGANTDNNAHLLKKGVFNVLQPFIDKGDIQIVYDQWTENWTPENAYANMKAALEINNNEIDAVIAANDATAGGVIKALEAQGLEGKIPVAGQDADLAAAQHIVQGTQTMTIYKPIKTLAYEAARAAIKMAEGEIITANRKMNNGKMEIPSLLLAPIAVDKNNIDDTIIADGFHRRDEVYEKRGE